MEAESEVIEDIETDQPVIVEEVDAEPDLDAKGKAVEKGIVYDDLALPQATVVKIIKDFLPNNTVISKEAKDIFRKISAYFILYVTDCAVEIATKKKRKTILPDDILAALQELDFDDMTMRLNQILLARKTQHTKSKNLLRQDPKTNVPQNGSESAEMDAVIAVTNELDDLVIDRQEGSVEEDDLESPIPEEQDGNEDDINLEAFVQMREEQRREVDITAFTASDDED